MSRTGPDRASSLLSSPTPIGDPESLGFLAGFRPRTTRSFCFGKRTQNQWRPGGPPQRGCLCPGPGGVGCGTRFAQTVLATIMEWTGPGHSPARRRQEGAFAVAPSVMPGLIGHPGLLLFRRLCRWGGGIPARGRGHASCRPEREEARYDRAVTHKKRLSTVLDHSPKIHRA